ncbi:MAG TPA: class I SAM-dependent methyltransferase [Dehalococcoidia bacterium]|nr:class I SAM-dependent methyltransferase [Dehalococcoidia bacterium]
MTADQRIREKVAEFYGHHWQNPEHTPILDGKITHLLAIFGDTIRGQRVLDAGSGSGMTSVAFARLGAAEVVGVDISRSCVDQANALAKQLGGDNIEFHQGDLTEALPVTGKFDIVYSFGVVQFTPACEQAFKNIGSYVDEGGRLAVALYPKTSLSPLWQGLRHLYRTLPGPAKAVWDYAALASVKLHDLASPSGRGRGQSTELEQIRDWFGVPHKTFVRRDQALSWLKDLGMDGEIAVPYTGRFTSTSQFIVLGRKDG